MTDIVAMFAIALALMVGLYAVIAWMDDSRETAELEQQRRDNAATQAKLQEIYGSYREEAAAVESVTVGEFDEIASEQPKTPGTPAQIPHPQLRGG